MTILLFILAFVAYFLCVHFTSASIQRIGQKNQVSLYRIKYITKTANIAIAVLFVFIIVNISGIEYSQISIFLSSVFAVIGIALFAQWSILSNITASLIIFFSFPYRVGDKIRIIDGDDDIYGVIQEIALFHVLIKREKELITYPNSLILQKGVIKNPVTGKSTKAITEDVT